jgi:hypothetical protein
MGSDWEIELDAQREHDAHQKLLSDRKVLLDACKKARDEFALLIDDNLTADPPRGTGEAHECFDILEAAIAQAEGK